MSSILGLQSSVVRGELFRVSLQEYIFTDVVISVSGMLTARACADHFEKVILVDSPGQAKTRSYQQEHPHGMWIGRSCFHPPRLRYSCPSTAYLIFMLDVLAKFWPSFLREAEEAGGV